ncbi:16S rRNA (cytidine(1402)-2'-O)-methyltransferase [Mycoplasma phocimorsus]|nr:16S rRNA (cytidine(1402)-2'-O)-methyltransferase [Mycoplasma phocimorsus]MDJ1648820.1 16S rRNA (cytidine(1402)-2'-O)-methyltransferase [Mycoplasma phocimorsus]
MNKLYIVPTPIGNLKDITIRALEVLEMVDYIACEDTRTSIKLLNHYNIKKPLIAHHIFNEKNSSSGIINLLSEGKNVALISDAGMPIIADPGFKLLSEVKKYNYEFEILPGASASILTFVYSSFGNTYSFLGFLEAKTGKRKNQLSLLSKGIYVAFISPYKLMATIEDFEEVFHDDVEIYLVKELTKLNEKHFFGTPKKILEQLKNSSLKGEFSICFKIK